jgi:hypothetical protein
MRRLPTVLSLCLCLALPAALAACGGDDGMSTAEYRAEAKTICTEADQATAKVKEPTRATSAAISDYFQRLLEANGRTTKRFEALDPPADLQKAHDDALAANEAGAKEVQRVIDELEGGGDPRKVLTDAQTRLQDLSRRSGDAAKRLGVPECADQ